MSEFWPTSGDVRADFLSNVLTFFKMSSLSSEVEIAFFLLGGCTMAREVQVLVGLSSPLPLIQVQNTIDVKKLCLNFSEVYLSELTPGGYPPYMRWKSLLVEKKPHTFKIY